MYTHRLSCFDLTDISRVVLLRKGTLQVEVELLIKVAWQSDTIVEPSMQLTPSTDGMSNLYTPYWSVVLFTEKLICSLVFGEVALNLHCM